jgi:hypothetical protein
MDCSVPSPLGPVVQVTVSDWVTGQPVEAWIGYTIVRADRYSIDLTVERQAAAARFALPRVTPPDRLFIKVYHSGYRLWTAAIEHDGSFVGVLPFEVELRRPPF